MLTVRAISRAALVSSAMLCAMPILDLPVARAATLEVASGDDSLRTAIAVAAPGDVLHVHPGRYRGAVVVDKSIAIVGEPGAIVDGGGQGSVITVRAAKVTLRDLTIRNSGGDLAAQDAAIFLDKSAESALVEGNLIEDNLFGVYLRGPHDAVIRGNHIRGRRDARLGDRGDGISIWDAPGSKVLDNDVRFGRDGIYVTTSRDNVINDNRFHELRFAVHYMYTNDSEISGNVSVGNHVGYALMYSDHLVIRGNLSEADQDQGILLNYANDSTIEGNAVLRGGTKCVFIYNSSKNMFRDNRFEACPIGIHFTAGSERNVVAGNAFIDNESQVKYVGTRWIEWSEHGRGNYWSDNAAFDLDGDGIADTAYRPNDLVDEVVWAHPLAKLLTTGPAMQLLRLAESQFPGLHPGGIIDRAPLMQPPGNAAWAKRESAR